MLSNSALMQVAVKTTPLEIPGPLLLEPQVHQDGRGLLWETYNQRDLAAVGIDCSFVQDNHSRSRRNVLRGSVVFSLQCAKGNV